MIRPRAAAVSAAACVLAAIGLVAPASAARAGVICNGSGCSVSLSGFVHLSGDDGGDNPGVTVPPPPCWYSPVSSTYPSEGSPAGAAVPMDKFFRYGIKNNTGSVFLADGSSYGGGTTFFSPFRVQADQVSDYKSYAHPQAGSWYGLDFDDTPAGNNCSNSRPSFMWATPGTPPPPPDVPPLTLALYAFKHLSLPGMKPTLDPAARSYVSLPTYVKMQFANNGGPTLYLPGGRPYRYVTASIPALNLSVTVWAIGSALHIAPGSPGATAYQPCPATGSKATSSQMANTGANAAIDCGVTYRQPSTGGPFTLTTSINWTAYWAAGQSVTPTANRQPVPNGQLTSQAKTPVNVAEIQNIN